MADTYNILSLDGGGAWALLQAMALGAIYGDDTPGHDILHKFNLVAANSGGSITLGALIEGKSPKRILQDFFYSAENRGKIFKRPGGILAIIDGLFGFGPRYSAAAKLDALRELMPLSGDWPITAVPARTRIGGWPGPNILIAAFDYDRRRAYTFRSNPDSLAANRAPPVAATLSEAIHASSNAPINYFDAPARFAGRQFWDGGVAGLNNPVMLAVVDALANGVARQDIRVLSIGTGTVFRPLAADIGVLGEAPADSSLLDDIRIMATSILDDPPDVATFQAHVVLDQPVPGPAARGVAAGNLVRLNPLIQPIPQPGEPAWRLPVGLDETAFKRLVDMDMDAVENDDVDLIRTFGEAWLAGEVANQPIRANLATLACEIGQDRFAAAAGHWRAVAG